MPGGVQLSGRVEILERVQKIASLVDNWRLLGSGFLISIN